MESHHSHTQALDDDINNGINNKNNLVLMHVVYPLHFPFCNTIEILAIIFRKSNYYYRCSGTHMTHSHVYTLPYYKSQYITILSCVHIYTYRVSLSAMLCLYVQHDRNIDNTNSTTQPQSRQRTKLNFELCLHALWLYTHNV